MRQRLPIRRQMSREKSTDGIPEGPLVNVPLEVHLPPPDCITRQILSSAGQFTSPGPRFIMNTIVA